MKPLDARIAAQVTRRADATALRVGTQQISYRAFGAMVDREAAGLVEGGTAPGSRIGWLGHNSPQMLAMLVACARVGAVLVPLNWRLAAPELAAIIRHAGLDGLEGAQETMNLAVEASMLAQEGPGLAAVPPAAGDLLLVYTSGTTGEPRGAMHTQDAMVANLDAAIATQGIDEHDRVLAVLPLFHVGGLCIQTLPALAAGAEVCLHPRFDPEAWFRDLAEWRPTTTLLVPAVMRALIEHPLWASADLSCLRFVNCGSQVVPLQLIEAFHARGVPVAQVYGATETGPVSIALPPALASSRAGKVGWPAPGVEVRLVDGEGRAVATGTVGEIQLRAPNLMRGYHREPSGSGFTADGWYATGDLAVVDLEGCHEVVGRSKELIISGGENIHPAEIENLAAGWPGVAEVAVVGVPDARWGEVPVLACVAKPGETIDTEALAADLRQKLAGFKQPRRIVELPELPKTALGKVQKNALEAVLQHARLGIQPLPGWAAS